MRREAVISKYPTIGDREGEKGNPPGRRGLASGGGKGVVNAQSKTHKQSWQGWGSEMN